jgi:iron complex outermembrane recepter protein
MKRNRTWFGIGACAGLATFLAAASPPAWAQDEPPPPADPESEATGAQSGEESAEAESAEAEGEVIVVTGSRIRTDPLDKQAPVRQLGREELERTGLVSVGDILQQLPASGGAVNGKFNSSGNAGFPPDGGGIGAGAIEADLRYLGSKRVLVLVDGVRWVNGSSASGVSAATDLNTIPLAIIERIEVLEDGASPIYGSDAIGGVINIITRKDYEGVVANAYTGGYHHGDGITQKYDVSWGATSEKLSIVIGASYLDQNDVKSIDRDISDTPIPNVDGFVGGSSATPQGRVSYVDPVTDRMVNLALNEGVSGVPDPDSDYHTFDTPDAFNFAPYNLVLTPSRRMGVFSNVGYQLHPRVKFQGRASFTNRESVNQAAPEPLFVGPRGGNGNRVDRISIHETNPFNPFPFTFDPMTNAYVITRRPIEAGPRRFEQTVNTLYAGGGFNGDFQIGEQKFFWDTTVAYGLNRADQRRNNSFNSAKLQQALGPAYDDNGVWRCGTAAAPGDPECVPFNIFGGQGADGQGTITQEMLDYVTYTQHDTSEQQLIDAVANLSGEIVPLPAGPLGVALGVEHRRLEGFFEPDAVVTAGDTADVPAQPTSGDYWVNEAYAEMRVPLVKEIPALQLLDVNGAVRVSDYSILEPEITGKVGLRWKPITDLILRASYGRGFRAPGIGELYGSESRFDATLTDPCSEFNQAPQAVRDRCIELGVPADGSYMALNPQISVTTGGNRDLEPETSDSINISMAYSPEWMAGRPWVDRFDIEAAYYDIRIDGAIAPFDAQLQLDNCVLEGDDTACAGIMRIPTGDINGFRNTLVNLGGIETRGVDLALTYAMPPADFGRFRFSSVSNLLIDFWEKIPTVDGERVNPLEGRVAGEPERAFPRLKSSLVIDWFLEEVGASVTTRYVHKTIEPCAVELDAPGVCSNPDEVDATRSTNELRPKVYNDLQVIWIPGFLDSQFNLTAGVNNVLNIEPPACYSCSLNGFNTTTYDVPGIFGYLSASYRLP